MPWIMVERGATAAAFYSFLNLSYVLSQAACLGKMIVSIYKWLKQAPNFLRNLMMKHEH
jgi:hypothetical protein